MVLIVLVPTVAQQEREPLRGKKRFASWFDLSKCICQIFFIFVEPRK